MDNNKTDRTSTLQSTKSNGEANQRQDYMHRNTKLDTLPEQTQNEIYNKIWIGNQEQEKGKVVDREEDER